MNRYATLRQQAKDLNTKTFNGSGAVRGIGAGQWFTLNDHPIHDDDGAADRQFTVLRHQFHARNNLPGDLSSVITPLAKISNVIPFARKAAATDQDKNAAGYWNSFEALRRHIPIVPDYNDTDHAKPTAPGSQTATVVGPAGEEIYTDEHGRIKIQFHWAREQDHDVSQHGAGAAKDDHSSCWVRMVMPFAGNQWGQQFLPRIGQEVSIIFIEGDIDKPLAIRALHNGQHNPPTFSGAGSLPANKTLSGIKSQEYKGGRYNELVLDDTTGEIRTKFSSEHGKTQLNQGYLIHPRSEGKGEPRGEGFELRTDNAGAIRAAQGLLLTTEPQQNASGKQLDRSSAKAQLEAAQNLTQQLGDAAANQHANKPTPEPKLNAEHLDNKQPYLHAHGHGGSAITTPQSIAIVTGKNLDQVAQRDTHQTSGRRWIHNVGQNASLYVTGATNKIKEAIKLIAAKGNIQLQAQSNDIEITADKKITITACKGSLTATAKIEMLMAAGGSFIQMKGGNITAGAAKIDMKAGSFSMIGPVSMNVVAPVMPSAGGIALAALSIANLPSQELVKIAENGATKLERRTARKAVIASARKSAADMPDAQKATTMATADRFERNIDAVEKAKLCQNIYLKDKPDDKLKPEELALKRQGVEGFKPMDSAEDLKKYGLKPADMSPANTNFRAAIYEPDKAIFGEDAKPVLVFKGTENMEDWGHNLKQGIGSSSKYYERAMTISEKASDSGAKFQISGHSLGGGLASAGAQVSGMDATTFNSAGLHKDTVPTDALNAGSNPNSKIQAHRLDGEILTYLQEDALFIRRLMVPAVGEKILIPNNNPSASRLAKHGMNHVIPAMEKQKTDDLHALAS